MKPNQGMSDISEGEMLRYFVYTLLPSGRFPGAVYYADSSNFGYNFTLY